MLYLIFILCNSYLFLALSVFCNIVWFVLTNQVAPAQGDQRQFRGISDRDFFCDASELYDAWLLFLSVPIRRHLILSGSLVPIYVHVPKLQLRIAENDSKASFSWVSFGANSSRDCVILSTCIHMQIDTWYQTCSNLCACHVAFNKSLESSIIVQAVS